ncbi:MAG: YebC/PmpR family DNA-binding transcriptional regulator [Christensenellales bacterium]|jgi:YebC/PmpR family DNA-binding regulatory protein
MSGHSKWNNIKRTKEKADAQRGRIFTKLVREISVAAKLGGPDPDINSRLKDAISKARQNNMPMDSINRAIKKAAGENDGANYEQINYEGYGVGGSAVIVMCLTDNRNRTAGDVRHAFDKNGGSLGQTGSVSYMFNRKGVIVIEKNNLKFDDIFEFVLSNDGEDLEEGDDSFVIYTLPEKFSAMLSSAEKQGFNVVNSEIEFVPTTYVNLNPENMKSFEKMINMLEENDDVSAVYHNVEL